LSEKRSPANRGQGRKPVPREQDEQVVRISITLPESDIAYLRSIHPKNLSAAIRRLIAQARSN
jgi:hypothetical protein